MTIDLATLRKRIEHCETPLGVVGLGYVGLPVSCAFVRAGFSVTGVDRNGERVVRIARGEVPMEGVEPGLPEALGSALASGRFHVTTDYARLRDAEITIVSVETPLDSRNRPDNSSLIAACQSVGEVMRHGALVIVESTVAPGTTEGAVRNALEKGSGRAAGEGFFVGHCPERVMPGRLLRNLEKMSRVCGGQTPAVTEAMMALYRHVVRGELDATDVITAELVKTAENAYRDVNIAFANELALICEGAGADVWEVRRLVNKSPGRNVLLPGSGVGGHCIPKDPWLLAAAAGESVATELIKAARAINDGMPVRVLGLLERGLQRHGVKLGEALVALAGYAYRENSGDTRNSPSATLEALLISHGVRTRIHDPFVPEYRGDLISLLSGADALVMMVAHDEYRTLPLERAHGLMRRPVIVDGRAVFEAARARAAGFTYLLLGNGR